jgi:hypothetical protein
MCCKGNSPAGDAIPPTARAVRSPRFPQQLASCDLCPKSSTPYWSHFGRPESLARCCASGSHRASRLRSLVVVDNNRSRRVVPSSMSFRHHQPAFARLTLRRMSARAAPCSSGSAYDSSGGVPLTAGTPPIHVRAPNEPAFCGRGW